MEVEESASHCRRKRERNLVMNFQRHLSPLLLSFPPTSNIRVKKDILTFQLSLTVNSAGFSCHRTDLSGSTTFSVGRNSIPGPITFIALGPPSDSQEHPTGSVLLFIEDYLFKSAVLCPFVYSEREERIVCGSLADYLQPPSAAHLFQLVMVLFSGYMPHGIRIPKSPITVDPADDKLKIPKIRLARRAQSQCGEWPGSISSSHLIF